MFSVEGGGDLATDAPARKPKPFLKRGEGVAKRLSAYKLRGEAEALRKERASSSSGREPRPSTSDQYAQDSSAGSQPQQQQRRAWQQPVQQEEPEHAAEPALEGGPQHHAAAGGMQPAAAAATAGNGYGSVQQDVEDLELEEFRALEREILGDSTHAAAAPHNNSSGPDHWQQRQQQHQQQQQALLDRQWQLQQQEEAAERQYASMLEEQAQQEQGEMQEQLDLQHPQQQQQLQHSVSAAHSNVAAGRRTGPDNSIHLLDMQFQDDTEWVDTEFSFADLSLEAQQDQTRAAGQNRARQQHQHQHQQQQQQVVQQAELHSSGAADGDGLDGPLSQQPYVRSIFRQQQQQQQQGRPLSSNGRLGTAAKKGPPRSGRSPARSSAAAAAAAADAAAADAADIDAEQEVVAVPAAAVARWQQLEAAQPGLQQEKAALRRMRQELEKAAQQLELQRAAWERDRAAQLASFEAWKAEETKQLANRRRVLDQQYKAMYKMPTKKDKTALEAIEAALERERADAKAAAARHKLTVERLRCRIKTLEDSNHELREEARWLGAQQLNNTDFAVKDRDKARRRPTCSTQTQTDCVLSAPARASDHLGRQADAWAAAAGPGARAGAAVTSNPLYAALFGADDEDDDGASSGAASRAQQQDRWRQSQEHLQGSCGTGGGRGDPAGTQLAHAGGSSSANGVRDTGNLWQGPVGGHDQGDASQTPCGDHFSFARASAGQQQQQRVYGGANSSSPPRAAPAAAAATPGSAMGRSSGGWSSASSQQQAGVGREVLKQYEHPDGKLEQLFDDGSREVHYKNGSSQVHRADGSVLVYFGNGDVKRQWPGGRVDYFYVEVSVWQCTHPDGLDVFYYPSGQVEGHFADGRKEVIFADGAARVVNQDGVERDVAGARLCPAVREAPPDLNNL